MAFHTVGVLGMSGFGKTVMCEALIRPLNRVIIFDYQHDDKYDSYQIATTNKAFVELVSGEEDLAVAFRGKKLFEYLDAIEYTADNVRDVCILFDEMSMYAPVRQVPESIKEIFFRGRRKGYSLIWNSHRPHAVDISVRSQTHSYVVFRTIEPLDHKALQIPPIEIPGISSLAVGEYRVYRDKQAFAEFLKETR